MVKIKIHRGTSQIGGTITEIYTENTHIFIDFGSELTVDPEDSTDAKMIDMIKGAECDAVLFSHYHGDHVGLLEHIPVKDVRGKEITLGIGKVARQVLVNIQSTLAKDTSRPEEQQAHKEMQSLLQDNSRWLDFVDALKKENEQSSTFDIGDFHITTIRVDHSAYDSYMFVIEAEGKCIVHTGDFRVHGRLGQKFFKRLENFMKNKEVDVLLIEGTMLGRLDEETMSEEELQKRATEFLKSPENKYVYLICSSTNMESLASFHNAVLDANDWKRKQGDNENRAMYVNSYVKQQMDLFASAEPEITRGFCKAYRFESYGKYSEKLHMSQTEYMEKHGFLCMIDTGDGYKKHIEPFKDKNPLLIYSKWDGYVSDKKKKKNDHKLKALYKSFPKKRRKDLHTSGHAGKKDLEEMIAIVNPGQDVVPIHTELKESFKKLKNVGDKLQILEDNQEYIVGGRRGVFDTQEKSLSKIKDVICLINNKIPENHKKNIFWCPKYMDSAQKQMGFTLYAYGGAVVSIYKKNDGISIKLFNNEYDKFFLGTWGEMAEKLNAIKSKRKQAPRLEELKKWNSTVWNMIMDAFRERVAEKKANKEKNEKSYMERKRETVIAKNNREMEQGYIRVVEMESKIPQEGKKPDLIGLRKDADTYVFSFIEYKCTIGGTKKVSSIEKHFDDMSKYYKNKAVLEQMITYNYHLEVLEERNKADIKLDDVKSEIVFLFSHIEKKKGVTAQSVYKNLRKLEKNEKFKEHKKDVKFIVLQDENELLNAMNYYGYEEMIKYLENNFAV